MQEDNFLHKHGLTKNILPEKMRKLQQIKFATKQHKRPKRPK